VTTVITVGSAVSFFVIAEIAVDFILQYIHPKKTVFLSAKKTSLALDSAADNNVGDVDHRHYPLEQPDS